MSDDLVKRARSWDKCWPSRNIENLVPEMADRIEELEATLSKSEALLAEAIEDSFFAGFEEGYQTCHRSCGDPTPAFKVYIAN
jgi:hypothetical protein